MAITTTMTAKINPNMKKRELHSSDEEYYSPYFEDYDSDGDSYSLAWRYLGVFIDEDDGYSRKVLWAAVSVKNHSRRHMLFVTSTLRYPC